MASKGRESWRKRQREQTKRERQEAKRAERAERRQSDDEPSVEGLPEEELYKQFAELSAAKANGEIDEETFEARKEEIWTQLGLELQ